MARAGGKSAVGSNGDSGGLESKLQQLTAECQFLRERVRGLEAAAKQGSDRMLGLEAVVQTMPLEGLIPQLVPALTSVDPHAAERATAALLAIATADVPCNCPVLPCPGDTVVTAEVQRHACLALSKLSGDDVGRQTVVGAGGLDAVVAAMRAHPEEAAVQHQGCIALRNITSWSTDAAAFERRQRAAEAGALEVVVAAMQGHLDDCKLLQLGCIALANISLGTSEEGRMRQQRAAEAGALEVVLAGMGRHSAELRMQQLGCIAISNVVLGTDEAALARQKSAADCGALEAVVSAMQRHASSEGVTEEALAALRNVTCGLDESGFLRKQRAAKAGALEAIVAGMCNFPSSLGIQEQGCAALANITLGSGSVALARKQRAADAGAVEAVVAIAHAANTVDVGAAPPQIQRLARAALRTICHSDILKAALLYAGGDESWLAYATTP